MEKERSSLAGDEMHASTRVMFCNFVIAADDSSVPGAGMIGLKLVTGSAQLLCTGESPMLRSLFESVLPIFLPTLPPALSPTLLPTLLPMLLSTILSSILSSILSCFSTLLSTMIAIEAVLCPSLSFSMLRSFFSALLEVALTFGSFLSGCNQERLLILGDLRTPAILAELERRGAVLGSFPETKLFEVSCGALRRFRERSGADAVGLGDGGSRDVAFRLTFLHEDILLVMTKILLKVNLGARKD